MAALPSLTPTTFAEALQFANALAESTMVPAAFHRSPANILVAIQWGAELGMGPLQALQNIAVINGRPAIYGDAMLALVRGSPLCEDVIETFEGEGETLIAICEARRRGSTPVVRTFSIKMAIRADLWGRAGPWKQYPLRMLQMRARGFALRDAFPDVLRGIIAAEEAGDLPRPTSQHQSAAIETEAELAAFADAPTPAASQSGGNPQGSPSMSAAPPASPISSPPAWYSTPPGPLPSSSAAPEHTRRRRGRPAKSQEPIEPDAAPALSFKMPSQLDPLPIEEPAATTQIQSESSVAFWEEHREELQGTYPAPLEEPPAHRPTKDDPETALPPLSVFVPFDAAGGNPQEWYGRARARLREMAEAHASPDQYIAFRKANFAPLSRLKNEWRSNWLSIEEFINGKVRS